MGELSKFINNEDYRLRRLIEQSIKTNPSILEAAKPILKLLNLQERKRFEKLLLGESFLVKDLKFLFIDITYQKRKVLETLLNALNGGIITPPVEPFVPSDVDNLSFWTKGEILPRDEWNTPNFQLNNEVGSPDLQLKTGSGIKFVSATKDHINTGLALQTSISYEILLLFKTSNVNQGFPSVLEFRQSGTNGLVLYLNGGKVILRHNSVDVFHDPTLLDDTWYYLYYKWDGATVDVEVFSALNGSKLGITVSTSVATALNSTQVGFIGSTINLALAANMELGLIAAKKDNTIFDLKNIISNPQRYIELVSEMDNVLFAYDFSDGRYLNNDSVTNFKGINGTFLTNAAGAYDAAINNLEFGLQKALHSYNTVSGRDILSPTPSGTTDILGNPISNLWKSGRINFGNYAHGGGTIGSTINSLDAANRTIVIGFHYKVTGAVHYLAINRSAGDGFLLLLTNSNRLRYDNKTASVNQFRVGLTDLLDGNKYIAAITHASDGTAQLYLMNVTLDEAVMSTDNTSANLGAVGSGSEIPIIGNLVTGVLPTPFPITPPLVFAKVLTLAELSNSANFLKTTM